MSTTPFHPKITVDRTSDVPLYSQIAEALATLILDGTLAPGTRIEDEVSMARRLEVSRPTARQALQRLVDRGLISRRRGAGTVVTSPHVRRPMELSSLLADLTKSGHVVSTMILEHSTHPADEEEAARLEVDPGTNVTKIKRVRHADGEPIALMENLLPASIAPTHNDLEHEGLYDLLRVRGVVPVTAAQTIGARNATAAEAQVLGEKRRAALLTVTRTAYDASGAVVEYGTHVYRASRYSFETTLFNA
ncbi:GntR family transcriptional regulator [Actinomyces sp. oral taxon 448]|jgi:possible transcriptional regulator|uniref:GntR family transcriptional regulator n=1 Tax=Actinomyces sp. oral taxon 448 TaxID=712124 RepID=UPI000218A0FB|nr:GntR family transcriptional regulator [Actinomyces sp. oral taxon 448]EGQ74320.1 GntR family transcriptional regulator [Actinomyces sp. oral taxon 448 str. F0400]